jgi:hypothetical protein
MQRIFDVAAFSTERRIPDGIQDHHHAKPFWAIPYFHLILPNKTTSVAQSPTRKTTSLTSFFWLMSDKTCSALQSVGLHRSVESMAPTAITAFRQECNPTPLEGAFLWNVINLFAFAFLPNGAPLTGCKTIIMPNHSGQNLILLR